MFPVDNIPNNESEINQLYVKLHSLRCPIAGGMLAILDDYCPASKSWKSPIKAACHYALRIVDRFSGGFRKFLHKKFEEYAKEFYYTLDSLNYPEGRKVAKLVCAHDANFITRRVWERSWFNETVYLPFEMMNLPAPSGYINLLDSFYGNWHEYYIKGRHADFYDTEHPCTYYTKEGHIPE